MSIELTIPSSYQTEIPVSSPLLEPTPEVKRINWAVVANAFYFLGWLGLAAGAATNERYVEFAFSLLLVVGTIGQGITPRYFTEAFQGKCRKHSLIALQVLGELVPAIVLFSMDRHCGDLRRCAGPAYILLISFFLHRYFSCAVGEERGMIYQRV